MTKKKKRNLIWLVLLTLVIASGITFAFMFVKTGMTTNEFVKSEVSCTVSEVFDSASGTKSSVRVQNTGSIPAYMRVRIVSNWVNEKDQIVGKSSEMPAIVPASGWIDMGDNTYCFQSAIAPGTATPEFLSSSIVLKEKDGVRQSVEILAEAIQSNPPEAVTEAWKVNVTDGIITGGAVAP